MEQRKKNSVDLTHDDLDQQSSWNLLHALMHKHLFYQHLGQELYWPF